MDEIDEDLLPSVFTCLSAMCSTDHEEQENLSNNEIWPTLNSLLITVLSHVSSHSLVY